MDDTSLFGSALAVPSPSDDRIPGTKGRQTSLFSDSGDLFSSSSYKSTSRNHLKTHATESHTPKFDPLFIHNSVASDLPSFEDSIDGVSSDSSERTKTSDVNTKAETNKANALIDNLLKDDLFSASTESNTSFLPKSKVNLADDEQSMQGSRSLFDEKQKDDIFSFSGESENSSLNVASQSVPKTGKKTKTTTDENVYDVFKPSTESKILQKSEINKIPEFDSLFDGQRKDVLFSDSSQAQEVSANKSIDDDLFSRSTDGKKSDSSKSTTVITQIPKRNTDSVFESLANSKVDLFNASIEDGTSRKEKSKDDDFSKKSDKSNIDPDFVSKPKGDVLKSNKPGTNLFITSKTAEINPVHPLVGDDNIFGQDHSSTHKASKADPLSDRRNEEDLSNSLIKESIKSEKKISATNTKPGTDQFFDQKPKAVIFGEPVDHKKSSSKKVNVIEDNDEDDIFKSGGRPFLSPPPFDFEDSDEFITQSSSKTANEDIFDDGDDIFAPTSSKKKKNEIKRNVGSSKVDQKNDKQVKLNKTFYTKKPGILFVGVTWQK